MFSFDVFWLLFLWIIYFPLNAIGSMLGERFWLHAFLRSSFSRNVCCLVVPMMFFRTKLLFSVVLDRVFS